MKFGAAMGRQRVSSTPGRYTTCRRGGIRLKRRGGSCWKGILKKFSASIPKWSPTNCAGSWTTEFLTDRLRAAAAGTDRSLRVPQVSTRDKLWRNGERSAGRMTFSGPINMYIDGKK